MQNSTPNTISTNEFNAKVRAWTISVRHRIQSNAPRSGSSNKNRTSEPLATSLTHQIKKSYGEANRIRYKFARHGVFVHYGVGRGYVRSGNIVVRAKNSKTEGMHRSPKNWYDVEIRQGLTQLATIAQEYYGDWAFKEMLSKIDKFTIQRK